MVEWYEAPERLSGTLRVVDCNTTKRAVGQLTEQPSQYSFCYPASEGPKAVLYRLWGGSGLTVTAPLMKYGEREGT